MLIERSDGSQWLGKNIEAAATAAVQAHNSHNAHCQVTLRTVEYGAGDKAATATATKLVADGSVVAVIGPDSQAGLAAMAPTLASAHIPTIPLGIFGADTGKFVFAGNADSAVLASHIAQYMNSTKNLFKVCVMSDKESGSTMLAHDVIKKLAGAADHACSGTVSDVDSAASKAESQVPDGVFFAGSTKTLGELITKLRKAGVTAGVYAAPIDSASLIKSLDSLAAGVTVLCPCAATPQGLRDQLSDTADVIGQFSTESYDIATILLNGIDSGSHSGADLARYLQKYHGQGYGGSYQWSKSGTLTKPRVWLYQIGV